jgi:alpha-L-fucosidase
VSKNGNLLLNFPLPNSGRLDDEELKTLDGITRWMVVNSEGIYATRPFTVYGEGPSTHLIGGAGFNEGKKPDLTAQDIRYTTKPQTIFAFVQGWPGTKLTLPALTPQAASQVRSVNLLGGASGLNFKQGTGGLEVTLPEQRPAESDTGITLKIIHT